MSFQANFGPISAPSTSSGPHFPDNVWFFCENYVLSSDDELANVIILKCKYHIMRFSLLLQIDEEFDIIFALATTKWVHLNWGDAGIRRFFFRVFRQLRSGEHLFLKIITTLFSFHFRWTICAGNCAVQGVQKTLQQKGQ